MSLQIIVDQTELLNSRNQWNAVSQSCPFRSWEWCINWTRFLATDMKPFVLVETDESRNWSAIAPMILCKTVFGETKIYSMGSGEACTDYTSLIVGPNSNPQLFGSKFALTLDELRNQFNYRIEIVEFDGVEISAPATQKLVREMKQAGYQAHLSPVESSWKLDLDAKWELLNSRFSKKHRRKTKKAIQRLDQSNVAVDFASNTDDFDGLWENFVRLHQLRRQMLSQSGCFADSRFELFLKNATQQLLRRGLAEIIQISHDGQPFASALLFHDQRNAMMYQTGFDPNWKQLEPGYLLIVASLLWSIENGFETFDFLRGDEPYKSRWQTKPVELGKLRFVDMLSAGSRIRNNLWVGYHNAKKKVKSVKHLLTPSR